MKTDWTKATLDDVNPPSLEAEALALLRELNDALAIPERFQARIDAILDRQELGASETPFLTAGGEPAKEK